MFSLTVREHVMIAHSFRGEIFGPAQRLHGATYVVDASFRRPDLDSDGLVVDIGLASETLKALLGEINYRNLDEEAAFEGQNTTTEFLAHWLWQRLAAAIRAGALGATGAGLTEMEIRLGESHVAWAAYSAPLPAA